MQLSEAKRHSENRAAWPILAAFAVAFLAGSIYFATLQNVWTDESTQLLGSRLPLGRMIAWLAGAREPLGVPPDRMPPGSYLIDWACAATLCGRAELGFRLLHIAVMAGAILALLATVARRFGRESLIVAGSLLALTPQMLTIAGEVRAYPLLIAVASVQTILFLSLFDGPTIDRRRLALFAAVGILACYIHFFGLVASGAFLGALLLLRGRTLASFGAIVLAGAAVLVAALGLIPFIVGAAAQSVVPATEVPPPVGPGDFALYLLRIAGHSSTMLATPLAALYFLLLGALVLLAGARMLRRRAPAEVGLAIAIALGLGVTMLAALVAKGFEPLKPSYSSWLWPPLAVLLASGCARGEGAGHRRLARAAAAAILLTLLSIDSLFLSRAGWFVHGSERPVAAALGTAPGDAAVLHSGDAWGFNYFGLVYRYGDRLPQYLLVPGGVKRIGPDGRIYGNVLPMTVLRTYSRFVFAQSALRGYGDLRQWPAAGPPPPPAAPLAGWTALPPVMVPGLYSAVLTTYRRGNPA